LLFLFSFFFVVATKFSSAQNRAEPEKWLRIERQIRLDSNLISLSREVESIRVEADNLGNDVDHARTLYYQMLIKDKRTEDTLYFKNSAFIDSVLMSSTAPKALKVMMHVLQAKRLMSFDRKYLHFRRDKYETRNDPHNYAALRASALDSVIKGHFENALSEKGHRIKPNRNLLWLTDHDDVFLFDPSLTDIVWVGLIDYSLQKNIALAISADKVRALLGQPSDLFLRAIDSLASLNTPQYATILYYKKWLASSKNDGKKQAFIETLLRKYVFLSQQNDSTVQLAYKNYLQTCVNSPVDMVKAHGVYQLCLLLYKEGLLYESTRDVKYKGRMKEALML